MNRSEKTWSSFRLFSLVLFVVTLFLRHQAGARSTGAPYEVCQSLTPRHGFVTPQPKTTNPYLLNVTLYPYMNQEEFVHVEVYSADDSIPFKGFIVQARLASDPQKMVDGTFVPMDMGRQSRVYNCRLENESFQGNNTWTHVDNSPKNKVSSFWFPENGQPHRVIFLATVLKDLKTYWAHIRSDTVQLGQYVDYSQQHTPHTTTATTSVAAAGSKETDDTTEEGEENENGDESVADDSHNGNDGDPKPNTTTGPLMVAGADAAKPEENEAGKSVNDDDIEQSKDYDHDHTESNGADADGLKQDNGNNNDNDIDDDQDGGAVFVSAAAVGDDKGGKDDGHREQQSSNKIDRVASGSGDGARWIGATIIIATMANCLAQF